MLKRELILVLLFTLVLSACNLPSSAPQADGIGSLQTQAALTVTAAAGPTTQTTSATSTPIPTQPTSPVTQAVTPTLTSTPCHLASFVADVTIPDDTVITLNSAFTKTWKIKNVGSCTWTSGYQLVFDSGDQMGGPASQQLTNGTVAPGQTIEISVDLTAPGSAGTYRGNWKFREPGGAVFGLSTGPIWVQIKASAASSGWPTYKKGDSGPEVQAIQLLLRAHGFDLEIDGIFGPVTQARVEDFQTQNNITKEDGIVGPETWEKLIIQVQAGTSGPAVRAVQRLLLDKYGYNDVAVDGDFGPITKTAVKDFQGDHGLTADGIVGPKTWNALISN